MAWDFGFMGGGKKPWLENMDLTANKLSPENVAPVGDVTFGKNNAPMADWSDKVPTTPMGQSKADVVGAGNGFDWKGLSKDLSAGVKATQAQQVTPTAMMPLMGRQGGGAISPAPTAPAQAAPSMSGTLTAITGGMQGQNFLEMLRRMR